MGMGSGEWAGEGPMPDVGLERYQTCAGRRISARERAPGWGNTTIESADRHHRAARQREIAHACTPRWGNTTTSPGNQHPETAPRIARAPSADSPFPIPHSPSLPC